MAENHLLTYYGLIGAWASELESECDQGAYEDDDGEAVSVKQARPQALDLLDRALTRLQALRADVATLPMSQLTAKYGEGGTDDY